MDLGRVRNMADPCSAPGLGGDRFACEASAARRELETGGAEEMCPNILLHLCASSAHPEAFTWAIPKSDLLQSQKGLKNAHCFLLKSDVLDIPLLKELAPLKILMLTVPL